MSLQSTVCNHSSDWRLGWLCCDGWTQMTAERSVFLISSNRIHCTVQDISVCSVYVQCMLSVCRSACVLHVNVSFYTHRRAPCSCSDLYHMCPKEQIPTERERERDSAGANISSFTTNCEQLSSIRVLDLINCPLEWCFNALTRFNPLWCGTFNTLSPTATKGLCSTVCKTKTTKSQCESLR